MDPVCNPCSPGAGKPPPVLVGRETELKLFDVVVRKLSIINHARSVNNTETISKA